MSRSESSSTYSVEPMRPHSSASHVANIIVRRGRHPARICSTTARADSSTLVVPLTLSAAPGPQPSRCAPITTISSGNSDPRMMPNVFQMGFIPSRAASVSTSRRAITGPGPMWYRKAMPPCHACGISRPRKSRMSSAAFACDNGMIGIRGVRMSLTGTLDAVGRLGQPGVLGSPAPFMKLPR
jgi:hypothetical protein